jgi:hypothetical protein
VFDSLVPLPDALEQTLGSIDGARRQLNARRDPDESTSDTQRLLRKRARHRRRVS